MAPHCPHCVHTMHSVHYALSVPFVPFFAILLDAVSVLIGDAITVLIVLVDVCEESEQGAEPGAPDERLAAGSIG